MSTQNPTTTRPSGCQNVICNCTGACFVPAPADALRGLAWTVGEPAKTKITADSVTATSIAAGKISVGRLNLEPRPLTVKEAAAAFREAKRADEKALEKVRRLEAKLDAARTARYNASEAVGLASDELVKAAAR